MAAMRLDTVAETSALCFFLFSLFFFLLNASSPFAIVVRGERERERKERGYLGRFLRGFGCSGFLCRVDILTEMDGLLVISPNVNAPK